ncbi:hypothetical protein [Williamsia sp. D3]|jgi:hypothetical protein|nr:hypothetical protein [Williamsia sp. D3]
MSSAAEQAMRRLVDGPRPPAAVDLEVLVFGRRTPADIVVPPHGVGRHL